MLSACARTAPWCLEEILVLKVSLFDMNHEFRQLLDVLADLIAAEVYEQRCGSHGQAEKNLPVVRQESLETDSLAANKDGLGKNGPFPIIPSDSRSDCRLGIANTVHTDQKTFSKEKNNGHN